MQKETKQGNIFRSIASFFGLNKPHIALGVAIVFLLAFVGALNYAFFLKTRIQLREQQFFGTQDTLRNQLTELTVLQKKVQQDEELLNVLKSPRIEIVLLNGLEVNPAGFGKIIWDPVKRTAILQISNLPPTPKDKDYQLWVIKDKQSENAGVFSITGSEKENFFKIERLVETDKKIINAITVTLEPKGGLPQPSGTLYLQGTPKL